FGSYGEYAIVESGSFARIPQALNFVEASALPVAGLTALKSLRDLIGIRPGQKLLINGASGGVGTFAVQLARMFGAHITATCSAANLEFVRDLGANPVLDYTKEDVRQREETYDGILDASAKWSFGEIERLLTKSGTYVTTVPSPKAGLDMLLTSIFPG